MEGHVGWPLGIRVPLLEKDGLGFGHVGKVVPSMVVAIFLVQEILLDSELEASWRIHSVIIRFYVVLTNVVAI